MNASLLRALALISLIFTGCSDSHEASDKALVSPDGAFFVEVQPQPPEFGNALRNMSWQIALFHRESGSGRVLAQGLQSVCGFAPVFDAKGLLLRLPPSLDPGKLKKIDEFKGLPIRHEFHEDWLMQDRWSPDRQWRAVQLRDCESTAWSIYLRKKGEATFSKNIQQGVLDPSLAGTFPWKRPLKNIKFAQNNRLSIVIEGYPQGVQLRERVRGVQIDWQFTADAPPGLPQKKKGR